MNEERTTCKNMRPTASLRTCLPLMKSIMWHMWWLQDAWLSQNQQPSHRAQHLTGLNAGCDRNLQVCQTYTSAQSYHSHPGSLYWWSFVKAAAGASLPHSFVEVAAQSRQDLTLAEQHQCPFSTVSQQRLSHAHNQFICQLQDWDLDL